MSADPTVSRSEAAAWKQALDFEGGLSAAAARALLRVRISAGEQERMSGLLEKARAGALTPPEAGRRACGLPRRPAGGVHAVRRGPTPPPRADDGPGGRPSAAVPRPYPGNRLFAGRPDAGGSHPGARPDHSAHRGRHGAAASP